MGQPAKTDAERIAQLRRDADVRGGDLWLNKAEVVWLLGLASWAEKLTEQIKQHDKDCHD